MMMGEDSFGVGLLVEEDGNVMMFVGLLVLVLVFVLLLFLLLLEVFLLVVFGVGEEVVVVGDEVVFMDEG